MRKMRGDLETEFTETVGSHRIRHRAILGLRSRGFHFVWGVEPLEHTKKYNLEEDKKFFVVEELEALFGLYSNFSEKVNTREKLREIIKQKANKSNKEISWVQIDGLIAASEKYCDSIVGSDLGDIVRKLADIAFPE